jgi:hypothetical protein
MRCKYLIATTCLPLALGCSGGGGSTSSTPAEDVAPSLDLREAIRATSGTFVIDPRATDANRDSLAFTWTLLEGPSGAYLAGEPGRSGASRFVVPLNGVYTFEVSVSDGTHTVSSETVVTVADPAAFRYEGRLVTDGSAESGVEAQLVWSRAGTSVLSTRTSASGTFQFRDVLGAPGDFAVEVAASGQGGP